MLMGETCEFVFRSNIESTILQKKIEAIWPERGFGICAVPALPDWTSLLLVTYLHLELHKAIDDLVSIGNLIQLAARDPVFYFTDKSSFGSYNATTVPTGDDIIISPSDLRIHYPGSDVAEKRYRFAERITKTDLPNQ